MIRYEAKMNGPCMVISAVSADALDQEGSNEIKSILQFARPLGLTEPAKTTKELP